MSTRRILAAGVAIVAVVAAVGVATWIWKTVSTSRNTVADNVVTLSEYKATDAATIERGRYVMRTSDCAACHTAGRGDMAGGYRISTPFGTLLSSNITPDKDTGIGNMTERSFFDAIRNGQGSKGLLYPAMPFTNYAKLSDQDMHDLWAYMSTLKPVSNSIDENASMAFPYNQRIAMLGWDMLFFDNDGFTPATSADAVLERGRYLVEGAAHCSACHTPRNTLGAEDMSRYLQGARIEDWYAPEITGNKAIGLGSLSVTQVADYLRTGTNSLAYASGPMAEAVEHSLQYLKPSDADAIAAYLKSLPGSAAATPSPMDRNTTQMKAGALAYEVNCSACHGVKGEGMEKLVPALAGNRGILSADVTNVAHVMLKGARAASTQSAPTGGGMPSFAWKMDDDQIAAVLNYVRNSWGNSAAPVDAKDLQAMRSAIQARSKIASQDN